MNHQAQPEPPKVHLTFIGGGTMACAILDGLLNSPQSTKYSFSVTARRKDHVAHLATQYPTARVVSLFNDNPKLWQLPEQSSPAAHLVLICTKPQQTADVCRDICQAHGQVRDSADLPVVVTMCPGITIDTLSAWLDPPDHSKRFSVVRTMPNTPVSICQGSTAIVASQHTTTTQVDCVTGFFRVFSPCVEILPAENLLNVAAAVSGSGPAYIFQFYKSLVAAGVQQGLPESLCNSLVLQTGVGASILAMSQPDTSLTSMISNVCVPGGSTEKGMKVLVDTGLQATVTGAVSASLRANRGMKEHEVAARI